MSVSTEKRTITNANLFETTLSASTHHPTLAKLIIETPNAPDRSVLRAIPSQSLGRLHKLLNSKRTRI